MSDFENRRIVACCVNWKDLWKERQEKTVRANPLADSYHGMAKIANEMIHYVGDLGNQDCPRLLAGHLNKENQICSLVE